MLLQTKAAPRQHADTGVCPAYLQSDEFDGDRWTRASGLSSTPSATRAAADRRPGGGHATGGERDDPGTGADEVPRAQAAPDADSEVEASSTPRPIPPTRCRESPQSRTRTTCRGSRPTRTADQLPVRRLNRGRRGVENRARAIPRRLLLAEMAWAGGDWTCAFRTTARHLAVGASFDGVMNVRAVGLFAGNWALRRLPSSRGRLLPTDH